VKIGVLDKMKKINGNIRKRSDDCWEASFYVNGERKYLYGKSYNEVRKALTAALHDVD